MQNLATTILVAVEFDDGAWAAYHVSDYGLRPELVVKTGEYILESAARQVFTVFTNKPYHAVDFLWSLEATFQPKKIDDLTDTARDFVGWHGKWVYAGMAPDDTEYAGQPTYIPDIVAPPFAWIPLCDLEVADA